MKESKTEGLKDYLKVQDFINGKIKHYESELAKNEEKIESLVSEPINRIRLLQGQDTGTITAMIEDVEVKQDLPKRVVWDQEKMKEIVAIIRDANDNPDQYVSAKYSISEKRFKSFQPGIQSVFATAREIKPGKAKLTFKIKEV